mmetsp:Transcript_36471/g.61902  ORF Transcript_36471/g.61902 Transcript_36471/m.61902 type:complete len:181 (-) Transcript_36471:1331-1873(-)
MVVVSCSSKKGEGKAGHPSSAFKKKKKSPWCGHIFCGGTESKSGPASHLSTAPHWVYDPAAIPNGLQSRVCPLLLFTARDMARGRQQGPIWCCDPRVHLFEVPKSLAPDAAVDVLAGDGVSGGVAKGTRDLESDMHGLGLKRGNSIGLAGHVQPVHQPRVLGGDSGGAGVGVAFQALDAP